MTNFGIFRGFSDKLFEGELPINLGEIGSEDITPITYLLDLYPSAAAAYSLRKLRSAYTGSAIRVRRSSDNTEQDIGFTALGALDTSSLTSFCGSGNGFVTTWYDQSGNTRNATQTTAANQPQIVSSGSVITQNDKEVLSFNGSSYYFNFNGSFFINTKYSIYYVGSRNSSKVHNYIIGGSGNTNNTNLFLGYRFDNTYRLSQFGVDIDYSVSNYTTATLSIWNAYNANSEKYIVLNNSVVATSTNTDNLISYNNSAIGYIQLVNEYYNGRLSELILYNSDQSSNRTGINTNINTYYGIY